MSVRIAPLSIEQPRVLVFRRGGSAVEGLRRARELEAGPSELGGWREQGCPTLTLPGQFVYFTRYAGSLNDFRRYAGRRRGRPRGRVLAGVLRRPAVHFHRTFAVRAASDRGLARLSVPSPQTV